MCDLDTPLNGLLLHSDTLCLLSYGGPEDSYEDGQESRQEEAGGSESAAPAVLPPGGRYYRPSWDRETEDAGDPGSGTTASPAVLPPIPDSGTTAGATGTSEMPTGYPYGTGRYLPRTTARN